jgi:hypothetical protein
MWARKLCQPSEALVGEAYGNGTGRWHGRHREPASNAAAARALVPGLACRSPRVRRCALALGALRALVANSLRSAIGKDNVAHLEDFVYAVEDRFNRIFLAHRRPKSYWKVPPSQPAPARAPALASTTQAKPTEVAPGPESHPNVPPELAPFQPISPGPVPEGFAPEGDGIWVPMIDARRPNEAPRLFKTLLHPDKSRSWAELFVVAVDLRTVSVLPVLGYQEPRTDKPESQAYVRRAKIPEEHLGALLAAFNGGFMAEHGGYGFAYDGITFLDPRDDACTLAHFSDGSFEVHSWTQLKERLPSMLWYRQAPACMVEDAQLHPLIKVHQSRKWGATLDGETVIRRSAVGLSADRQVLYVGITNHTTAKVLASGMQHAGAVNVAQMDVNWSYPKFVTYAPDPKGVLRPVALAEGFEFSDDLYLRERSMRDFFYLARKEEVHMTWPALGGPAPGEPGLAAPKAEEAPSSLAAPSSPAKVAPSAP